MIRKVLFASLAVGILAISGTMPVASGQDRQPKKLVTDVLDYVLQSNRWSGPFGWVTFRLQQGFHQNNRAYFIRTDASDEKFAAENGLVFTPRLRNALSITGPAGESATADLYLFREVLTASGQVPSPVLSTIPGRPDYTPIYRIHLITRADHPERLTSTDAIEMAKQTGEATVQSTDIVVNYPVVKWPGGELPYDTQLEAYLGEGQLIAPVNVDNMQVTFKLQHCYPGMHYIVTDVSFGPGSQAMNIAHSPKLAMLQERPEATLSQVYVFGNGVRGGGPMGFQSSVMDPPLGGPSTWTALWDHYTMVWTDPAQAKVLTSFDEIQQMRASGMLQMYNGVPDTHPNGFVVNCPVPIGVSEAD
ncbi:MAG: hypothetical protein HY650_03200 [Acidobacteria bacterium]|nr:hypothetical protein [Acidobacteriota bacterium]